MSAFRNPLLRQAPPPDDDQRILPLINVVFLLLVFFMVAGTFQSMPALDIEPATADAAEAKKFDVPTIAMDAGGAIAIGERVTSLEGFKTAWQQETGGLTYDRVRVYADGALEANRLVEVMETLRTLGVASVQLLTLRRDH